MAPIDYVATLGQARCTEFVRAKLLTASQRKPELNYWLFTGSKNTDGYGQIFTKTNESIRLRHTGRGVQKAFLLHVIAFVSISNRNPTGHVSHLCDTRACFNPDHLVDEPAAANNARKGCPGDIYCSDHGHLVVPLCQHSPKCLRPLRNDVRCCLSIKNSDPGWASSPASSRPGTADGPGSAQEQILTANSSQLAGYQDMVAAGWDYELIQGGEFWNPPSDL